MPNALYGPGETYARSLIRAGKVNDSDGWSMSAEDENKLLGDPPDWTAYASWHLGEDDSATEKTKGRYKYPFGKNGELYRSALRAIASRAGQQGDTEISSAASALITEIDKGKKASAQTRAWYRMTVRDDAPPMPESQPESGQQPEPAMPMPCAEINIFDEIGAGFFSDGVTAKQFVADLAALPDTVRSLRVHVNSPGGDVFDALAIANALRDQRASKGRVVAVSIEGLAASAATIVTSAGAPITMADNALLMVHNPSGVCLGNAEDMRQVAGVLDRVRGAIIATYRWTSQLSVEALGALMDARTWMDAAEAVKNGFATAVTPGVQVSARFNPENALTALGEIPESYRARVAALLSPEPVLVVAAPVAPPAPSAALVLDLVPDAVAEAKDIIRTCREAGFPELAEDLLGHTTADVTAKLEEAKAARAIREAQTAEIRALCATAKFPDLAEGYIRGGMATAEVKSQLTALTAKRDAGVINPSPPGAEPAAAVPVLRPIDVYRARQAAAVKGV